VDILVSRLRRKLEPLDCIKTLRNAGYTLALRRAAHERMSQPARPALAPARAPWPLRTRCACGWCCCSCCWRWP
jgi:hypothetical protein